MKKRGFTLVEILIIIAIIAILVAILVPNLIGAKKRSDMKKNMVQVSVETVETTEGNHTFLRFKELIPLERVPVEKDRFERSHPGIHVTSWQISKAGGSEWVNGLNIDHEPKSGQKLPAEAPRQ